VIIPVIQQVGEDWINGLITTAGEHAATSFIKEYLSHSVRSFTVEEGAPVLVVTTPAGQLHDLSAFIGSCQARKSGWKIVYLGASLPADAIAWERRYQQTPLPARSSARMQQRYS